MIFKRHFYSALLLVCGVSAFAAEEFDSDHLQTSSMKTRMKTKNFPPTVRNPVDQIKAYVGQLLVFEVPKDTFYDPEDFTELKLTLLNGDRSPLEPGHWLQFDAKIHELHGVPTLHDKTQQYFLVAEDKQGLTASDAFTVEITVSPDGESRNQA